MAALADPTGLLLTSIRDHAAVSALTTRVRVDAPAGRQVDSAGVETDAGDARGPGEWVRFVVLVRLARTRAPHVPTQDVRYVARCYGQGGNPAQDADALAAAVSEAVHDVGRRVSGSGVVIFYSFDEGDSGPVKDPDTGQPHTDLVISVGASTAHIT